VATPDHGLIACHDCDLLQRDVVPPPGGTAACPRCGAIHYRYHPYNRQRALALAIAAAILFLIANLFPIVGIEAQGNRNSTTLLGAVHTLWHEDMPLVAALVLVTTVLAPAFELVLVIWLLMVPRPAPLPLRLVLMMQPWRMVEVFMLGLLVSVVKLSHLASIEAGVALWAFAALLPLFALLTTTFNPRDLWASMASR
jgi:paraquat-inducible protein A